MKMRASVLLILLSVTCLTFFTFAGEPQMGGTFRYAMNGEPPHLDPMLTTDWKVVTVGRNVFETLCEFDSKWKPVPMLAESFEVSSDGLTVVFHLRDGVKFHNGKTMTSEDVAASVTRWGMYGQNGSMLWRAVDHVATPDDLTFEVYLKTNMSGVAISLLSNATGGPVIMPAEIIGSVTRDPITPEDVIGTGPYKFDEWMPNRYIRLVRFTDYAPVDLPPDGYSGKKVAYFDTIMIYPVSDENARFAGVQSGDFDLIENVSVDLYNQVAANTSLQALLLSPPTFPAVMIDNSEGVTTNLKLRQAMLAALDMKSILEATYGDPTFWTLSGSMFPPGTIWFVPEADTNPLYNQANPVKARQLAEEAGYAGEPLVFVFPSTVPEIYKFSLVVAEQLREAGLNVKTETYDWATYASVRQKPELFDLASSTFSFKPDPAMVTLYSSSYVPHWDSPEKNAAQDELTKATTFEARYAAWEKIQGLVYQEVPFITIGFGYPMFVSTANVENLDSETHPFAMPLSFWNTWFAGSS